MCLTVPGAVRLLGHPDEGLRLRLRLRGARAHHHRLLLPDGAEAEERPDSVRLPGEGPQPASHHPAGGGGGGRVRGLLDAHPHLHPHQGARQRARDHRHHGGLLLLRGSGLHQQQPEPRPLRLPGRELQALLQGLLSVGQNERREGFSGEEGFQQCEGGLGSTGEPGQDQ